jgi:hypothetical protein
LVRETLYRRFATYWADGNEAMFSPAAESGGIFSAARLKVPERRTIEIEERSQLSNDCD